MFKKLFSLLLPSIFLFGISKAQQIGPSTINSSGGGAIVAGNSFDYSIGEMTVVSTASPGNVYTQGTLQPDRLKVDAINNIELAKDLFSVFPNPTASALHIKLKNNTTAITAIQLVDALGNTVLSQKMLTGANHTIDMNAYASGVYSLQIQTQQYANPFSFKITKTN